MDIIYVKDIIEDNGKTIFENNMEKVHNIPIGSLVEVKYNEWFGNGSCEIVLARLFVVSHDRDCDGTPLYSLCKVKEYNENNDSISLIVQGYVIKKEISKAMYFNVKSGFDEESLKVIELTDDIKKGKDSLDFESYDIIKK
jgi:hypothetical protein